MGCKAWRECLTSENSVSHEDQLRTIMTAAGGDEGLNDTTQEEHLATEIDEVCMNPLVEDPESWDCDCFEAMQRRCAKVELVQKTADTYSLEKCLRAIFCLQHGVCESWKTQFCTDVDALTSALALVEDHISATPLLLVTRSHNDGTIQDTDGAVGGKT